MKCPQRHATAIRKTQKTEYRWLSYHSQRAHTGAVNFASLNRGRKFRQVSVRGLHHVFGEFSLLCAAQNLFKIYTLGASAVV